jgi:hypothetical protein
MAPRISYAQPIREIWIIGIRYNGNNISIDARPVNSVSPAKTPHPMRVKSPISIITVKIFNIFQPIFYMN